MPEAARVRGRDRGAARAARCPAPRQALAIVLAVPMTVQWPSLRQSESSISFSVACVDGAGAVLGPEAPAVGAGAEVAAVPAAGEVGPPVIMMVGMSALAAPINWAGMVLSQAPSSTTPFIGWARIISSVSIAIRLRKNIDWSG